MSIPLGLRAMRDSFVASAIAPAFDITTLGLSGLWRGNYAGAPWTPTASAGGSGANGNLVVGTAPTVGAAQGGYTPATEGGTHYLTGGVTSTFLTTAAGSLYVLCKPSATAVVASLGHDEPSAFATSQAELNITYTTSGFGFVAYDGVYKVARAAATSGAYHLAQVKYNSSIMRYRVDGGAWVDLATGPLIFVPGNIQTGVNYALGAFFVGDVLEIGTSLTEFSDATFDNVKSYVNSRYGLAL